MKTKAIYFFVAILGLTACQTSDEKTSARKKTEQLELGKTKEANDFLIEVATGVHKEVELSRLAQEKATLTKVKEFAKNMITDHDNNLEGLKDLAARKNIKITLVGNKKLGEQMKILSALQGIAFDKEYVKMMVEDHTEDVERFKKQAESGKDIETKAFAAGKLAILRHNLDMAKTLHDSMIGT